MKYSEEEFNQACDEAHSITNAAANIAKLNVAIAMLRKIEEFGHSHGHGRGYTCANWAKETLEGIENERTRKTEQDQS